MGRLRLERLPDGLQSRYQAAYRVPVDELTRAKLPALVVAGIIGLDETPRKRLRRREDGFSKRHPCPP